MFQPISETQLYFLRKFYERFSDEITDEIWDKIGPLHQFRIFKKGEVLIGEGETCNWFGIVLDGACRVFHTVNGKEIVSEFFLKGNMISAFSSYISRKPFRACLDAISNGNMIVITREAEQKIAKLFPDYYKVTKLTRDVVYIRSYNRYVTHLLDNAETRYVNILENRPELLQEAPQYMIASFLGITPEAFSRIRNQISQKK